MRSRTVGDRGRNAVSIEKAYDRLEERRRYARERSTRGMRCALLVEQHAVFRQAMARLLESHLEVELVEEAATVAEARALALGNLGDIDVVVSELALPDGAATDFLAALREAEADVPVLVLAFRGDRPSRERALELGAARVMGKDAPVEEIFAAIRELGARGTSRPYPP